MKKTVKRPTLKNLSDNALLSQIEKLRHREHLSTVEILLHLNEVERRRLHLKLGYGSLFDYCVKHLGYSQAGAGRRVAVARCVARYPEVLELLYAQKTTMTNVSLVASVLDEANKTELLAAIQGRSQAEVDAIASRYRRPVALKDRVRTVRVLVPEARAAGHARLEGARPRLALEGVACEKRCDSHNGSDIMLTRPGNGSSKRNHRSEQKLLIQFLANPEFMKKYEEVRALMSQRLSDTSFEQVFGALIEEFLDRHSPVRRTARRESKKKAPRIKKGARRPGSRSIARRPSSTSKTRPRSKEARQRTKTGEQSCHIPTAVRDKVFVRDKGRCTYIGKTGRKCESTQALQIDHIKPVARGGTSALSNLRLVCAKHNRLAADEVFGEAFTERFQPIPPGEYW